MEHVPPKALSTLERLLEIPAARLDVALSNACELVAESLVADKVDAFLYDASRDSLVALGTSYQPLSTLQRQTGLDVLPVVNGGTVVRVFQTGQTVFCARVDENTDEVRGIKEVLGVRSHMGIPLNVGGVRRGVLMIASKQPDYFDAEDVRFAEMVARWVGVVAHRAQLVEEIARNAVEQGRRAVAEELITVLAHDLRNHLSPVSTRLALLARRAEQEARKADLRDIELANGAMRRATSLISDILDVARIDQGVFELDPKPLDLGALVRDASKIMSTPNRPVDVSVSDELLIVADEARVRQCLENLLSNALKYSPQGAPVTVTASKERGESGEWARVVVTDEGPGIPAQLMPRIFERFVTGNQRGGLGLGLFLAKRIAVAHGGDLRVDSAPSEGSRFTLLLPCHTE